MQDNPIVVTCAKGITPYLKQELQTLGFPAVPAAPSEDVM